MRFAPRWTALADSGEIDSRRVLCSCRLQWVVPRVGPCSLLPPCLDGKYFCSWRSGWCDDRYIPFPFSTRAVVRYVKQLEPSHQFNAISARIETETKQHVDAQLRTRKERRSWMEIDGDNTDQIFNQALTCCVGGVLCEGHRKAGCLRDFGFDWQPHLSKRLMKGQLYAGHPQFDTLGREKL